LFPYDNFVSLKEGDFFGDYSLDVNKPRTVTVKAFEEETHLAVIGKELYYEYILKEKIKIRKKHIDFLFKNFFSGFTPKSKFENKYFTSFILEHHYKDEIIIKENEEMNHDYLIFEGSLNQNVKKIFFEL